MDNRSRLFEDPERCWAKPRLDSTFRPTEESRLLSEYGRCLDPQVGIGALGSNTATGSSLQKTELDEVRLVHIHDSVCFLTDCRRQCLDADWPAAEFLHNRAKNAAIDVVKSEVVNVEHL